MVKSYYHSFKLPVIIVRGNNVMGPRQYPEKLIPRFTTHLLEGKKCPIQGTGDTRRNFIYVEDVCNAVDIIVNKGKLNNVYNIGSEYEYSVKEILMNRKYDINMVKHEILAIFYTNKSKLSTILQRHFQMKSKKKDYNIIYKCSKNKRFNILFGLFTKEERVLFLEHITQDNIFWNNDYN